MGLTPPLKFFQPFSHLAPQNWQAKAWRQASHGEGSKCLMKWDCPACPLRIQEAVVAGFQVFSQCALRPPAMLNFKEQQSTQLDQNLMISFSCRTAISCLHSDAGLS